MSFFSKIANYLGTEIVAKALANNKMFQWFALNTVGELWDHLEPPRVQRLRAYFGARACHVLTILARINYRVRPEGQERRYRGDCKGPQVAEASIGRFIEAQRHKEGGFFVRQCHLERDTEGLWRMEKVNPLAHSRGEMLATQLTGRAHEPCDDKRRLPTPAHPTSPLRDTTRTGVLRHHLRYHYEREPT